MISQDTSAYGRDLRHARYGKAEMRAHITDLARELGQLGAWVRMHYIYPYASVDELVPLMADGLILPYLDIPFQHASPRVLKAMRRICCRTSAPWGVGTTSPCILSTSGMPRSSSSDCMLRLSADWDKWTASAALR